MKCYYHPEVDATATCADCGKAICQDCAVDMGGKLHCRECLARGSQSAAVPMAPTTPTNQMARNSMLFGLGGWLAWLILLCFNITIGSLFTAATAGIGAVCLLPLVIIPYLGWVPAVITGHKAIKELNEVGNEEQGRGMALTGLISGYIALGITLILCLLIAVLTLAGASVPLLEEFM